MANKSKQQLQQSLTKLNDQYNSLLQKNQNDLIKIKQKQKTFNETIEALKKQKEESEKKYKNDINVLMLELEKVRNGVASTGKKEERQGKENQEALKGLRTELADAGKEIEAMRQLVDHNKERIEHLEQNARKLIDENITLTSNFETSRKQMTTMTAQVQDLNKQKQSLMKKVKQLQNSQSSRIKTTKQIHENSQTEGDFTISAKEHTLLLEQFNSQIRQLNKEIESKEEQNEQIKNRLRQTNDELKRFMERDKRNNVLLKKKSQELETLQAEIQGARKTHKTERKRLATEDSCAKCKEWEQENKLLKEMVKSMQTMVRVREMEAERYKNRQALNNSKVHEKPDHITEPKKSRGELPPLGKK